MKRVCGAGAIKRLVVIFLLYVGFIKIGKYFIPSTGYLSFLPGINDDQKTNQKEVEMMSHDTSQKSHGVKSMVSSLGAMDMPKLGAHRPGNLETRVDKNKPRKSDDDEPLMPHKKHDKVESVVTNKAIKLTPSLTSPQKDSSKFNPQQDPKQAIKDQTEANSGGQPRERNQETKPKTVTKTSTVKEGPPLVMSTNLNISQLAGDAVKEGDIEDLLNISPAKCTTKICTQDQRRNLIQKQCQKLLETPYGLLSDPGQARGHLLVDDIHKLIYCIHPGAASMSMVNVFYTAASGQKPERVVTVRDLLEFGVKPLRSFPPAEQDTRLSTYHKFVIARHPFDKLVSVWNIKLAQSHDTTFYRTSAHHILALAGRNTTDELAKGVTFKEFLDYIVYTHHSFPEKRADLWDTNMNICHPCYIEYDRLLKLETFEVDSRDILTRLQVNKMPNLNRHRKVLDTTTLMTRILPEFKGIDTNIINYLLMLYKADMEMFGYKWDADQNMAVCGSGSCESDVGYCC